MRLTTRREANTGLAAGLTLLVAAFTLLICRGNPSPLSSQGQGAGSQTNSVDHNAVALAPQH